MDSLNDTQHMDTQVWEGYTGRDRYGAKSQEAHTYGTGEDGHVDFAVDHTNRSSPARRHHLHDPKSQQHEDGQAPDLDMDSEDELAQTTQGRAQPDVTSPAMPTPATPAYAPGKFIGSETRPAPQDLSNVIRMQNKTPKLGLSQLFAQTQATSSPVQPAVTPGGVALQRPSPIFREATSPRKSASSPILPKPTMTGHPELRDNYITRDQSQELRRRQIEAQRNSSPIPEDDGFDDSVFTQKKRKRIYDKNQARAAFQKLTVSAQPLASGKRKLSNAGISRAPGHSARRLNSRDPIDLVSDELPLPSPEPEIPGTEDEESQDEYDELSQEIGRKRGMKKRAGALDDSKRPAKRHRLLHPQSSPMIGLTSDRAADWSTRRSSSPRHRQAGHSHTKSTIHTSQLGGLAQRQGSGPGHSQSERIADSQPAEMQNGAPQDSAPPYPIMPSSVDSRRIAAESEHASLSSNTRERLMDSAAQVYASSSLPPGPPPLNDQLRDAGDDFAVEDVPEERGVQTTSDLPREDQDRSPDLPSSPPVAAEAESGRSQLGRRIVNQRHHQRRPKDAIPESSPAQPESQRVHRLKRVGLNASHRQNHGSATARPDSISHFSTAQTHLSISPAKRMTPERHLPESASISQSPNIRRMSDFAAASQNQSRTEPVQIRNALSRDDVEFNELVSSPQTIERMRPIRRSTRPALVEPSTSVNRMPLSETKRADSMELEERQSTPTPTSRRRQHSPNTQDTFEPASPILRERRATKVTRRLKGIAPNEPTRKLIAQSDADELGQAEVGEDKEHASDEQRVAASQATRGNARMPAASSAVSSPLSTPPTSPTLSRVAVNIADECKEARFPQRVFARFTGPGGTKWYTATITGSVPNAPRQIKVRFDDGNVTVMDYWLCCSLELRLGDVVQVDRRRMTKHSWIVKGFKDPVGADPGQSSPYDTYGHATVCVEKKLPRASLDAHKDPSSGEIHEVAVRDIYLNGTTWSSFKDRRFQDPIEFHAGTPRPMTPLVESGSTTPASRKRRHGNLVRRATPLALEVAVDASAASGIFANMTFALTFCAQNASIKDRTKALILGHGGSVLEEAFDKLFETPQEREDIASPANLRLKPAHLQLGFTALITDTFSRKTKYLQALALNLPCLHYQWIVSSSQQATASPWLQYLLPAGESDMLNKAVRSRTLHVSPGESDAAVCALRETLEHRPQLMRGQNVLISTQNLNLERKRTFFFLAHAMGAQKIKRVNDVHAAKQALRQDGDWNWLCVDMVCLEEARQTLLGPEQAKGRGGRRKRAASTRPDALRIIGDQFIIQSLIFGALAEA